MSQQLPAGWASTQDARGRTYYYNAATQATVWKPEDIPGYVAPKPPGPPPVGPPGMPPKPPVGPPAVPKPAGPPSLPPGGPPKPVGPPGMPPKAPGPPPLNVQLSSAVPPPLTTPVGPPPLTPGGAFGGPPKPPGPPPMTPGGSMGKPPVGPPVGPPPRDRGASNAMPPIQSSLATLPPIPAGLFAPQANAAPPALPPPVAAPVAPPAQPKPATLQVPQSSVGAPAGVVPYPWKTTTAPGGKIYYINEVTGQSSWDLPTAPGTSPAPPSIPPTIPGMPLAPVAPPTPAGGPSANKAMFAPPTSSTAATSTVNNVERVDKWPSPSGTKEYAQSCQLRAGVFKSWEAKHLVIKTAQVQIWDTEAMKKSRVSCPTKQVIAVPLNRGDGKNIIVLYEYNAKVTPTIDTLFSQSSSQHYIEASSLEQRDIILRTLHDQGAIVRQPIWESPCTLNKEQRFCAIYENELDLFKKAADDVADLVFQYDKRTFFQAKPSVFPLLYEEKNYGVVAPQTFVIANDCNEDTPLYYITMTNTDGYEAHVRRTERAIQAKQQKVDPSSLHEGWCYKASTNFQKWARRYVILRDDKLCYYKQAGDDKPAGEIPLPNGFELDLHPTVSGYPLGLLTSESGDEGVRQLLMCALNEPEYDAWSQALGTLQQKKSIKKDQTSVREGYMYVCEQKQKPSRKFFVITEQKVSVYHSRKDITAWATLQLTKGGTSVAEASLPEHDVLNGQKLFVLSIIQNNTQSEFYLGFPSAQVREEWMTTLKNIVGDTIAKTHPDSYREGYVYKSKKRGSPGSVKYCVITPTKVYYSDKKEANVLSDDKEVQKRIKSFDLAGDAVIEIDSTSLPGYKGLIIPASGDDGNSEFIYLYYPNPADCDAAYAALISAMASVDWRRDKSSVFEGYLYKSSTSGKQWAFRYVVVTTNAITYYKKKFDPQPAGQFPITPGFKATKLSLQDSSIQGPDRVALDYFASELKIKPSSGQDLFAISLAPPVVDDKSRTFWVGSVFPDVVETWVSVFADLSAHGKTMHDGTVKEGYLAYNGQGMKNRKYVALFPDRIEFYKTKLDTSSLDKTIPLPAGFDILCKNDTIYISAIAHEDLDDYHTFTICPGGDSLQNWLQSFQEVYQQRTPATSASVLCQSCAYVQYNTGTRQFLYVVVFADKIAIFQNRTLCYPSPSSTEPLLANAKQNVGYTASMLTLQDVDTLKFIVKTSGIDQFTFDFRTEAEKTAFYDAMTEAKSAPAGGIAAAPKKRLSVSTRPAAFAIKPKAPQMEIDLPPPPPAGFFEEEDLPPPPPPEFDDDLPAPPIPDAPIGGGNASSRAMPLYSDDEDEPQFLKDKKAAVAAAPAPVAPSTSFKKPEPVKQEFKPPVAVSGGMDLDFSFDLPPAPLFELPPPDDDAPPAPTGYGANRFTAAAAKPAAVPTTTQSKYIPVDFDDDDDDLPPPGGGGF